MKRYVRIVVEGTKDLYFLSEFIRNRFPGFSGAHLTGANASTVTLSLDSCTVEIHIACGHNTKKQKTAIPKDPDSPPSPTSYLPHLRTPPEELDAGDLFVPALLFDADECPKTGENAHHAGVVARRAYLQSFLDTEQPSEDADADAPRIQKAKIFLLPNDERDGDLETLLREMINPTSDHQAFFSDCWDIFAESVADHKFNPTTRKSMMNEYAAAFDANTWKHNGVNKSLQNATLWDWNAPVLGNLYNFLRDLLSAS